MNDTDLDEGIICFGASGAIAVDWPTDSEPLPGETEWAWLEARKDWNRTDDARWLERRELVHPSALAREMSQTAVRHTMIAWHTAAATSLGDILCGETGGDAAWEI